MLRTRSGSFFFHNVSHLISTWITTRNSHLDSSLTTPVSQATARAPGQHTRSTPRNGFPRSALFQLRPRGRREPGCGRPRREDPTPLDPTFQAVGSAAPSRLNQARSPGRPGAQTPRSKPYLVRRLFGHAAADPGHARHLAAAVHSPLLQELSGSRLSHCRKCAVARPTSLAGAAAGSLREACCAGAPLTSLAGAGGRGGSRVARSARRWAALPSSRFLNGALSLAFRACGEVCGGDGSFGVRGVLVRLPALAAFMALDFLAFFGDGTRVRQAP